MLHGDPSLRLRFHGYGMSQKRYVWTGPSSSAAVQKDFSLMFHAPRKCTACHYMMVSDEERMQYYVHLAANQGRVMQPEDFVGMEAEELCFFCLPPGANLRMQAWLALPNAQKVLNAGRPFCFDVGCHPVRGGAGGDRFPCQLTHGTVVQALLPPGGGPLQLKIATPLEHLQAQGWNCVNTLCPRTEYMPIFNTLSTCSLKRLSGNGMHLKVEAAWMMYCLGHTVRREQANMTCVGISSDEDEETLDGSMDFR